MAQSSQHHTTTRENPLSFFGVWGVILTLVFPATAYSQPHRIRFERIPPAAGLSSAWVTSITQDSHGFLWIGTFEGLNRYDGYQFRVFKSNPQDSTTFQKDFIGAVCEDARGTLWVGTSSGLYRYDHRRLAFTRYPRIRDGIELPEENKIRSIVPDTLGRLWLGTEGGGVACFDPDVGTFRAFRHETSDPLSLSHDSVEALLMDSRGSLWIATWRGLDKLDPITGALTRVSETMKGPDAGAFSNIHAMVEARDGTFWLGTWNFGLVRFNPRTGATARFTTRGITPGRTSPIWVTSLWEDRDGCLFAGTEHEGLLVFNPTKQTFQQHIYDHRDPGSLSSRSVASITCDRSGIVWVGTYDGGLNKFDSKKRKFEHYTFRFEGEQYQNHNDIWSIHEDSQGILWVGTSGKITDPGLIRFERRTGKYSRVFAASVQSVLPNVYSIREEAGGDLWFGSYGDGLFLRKQSGEFAAFRKEGGNSLAENYVRTLSLGPSGTLWVGTRSKGVMKYDRKRNAFARLFPELTSLSAIVTLCEDGEKLWVGTAREGLFRIDGGAQKPVQFKSRLDDSTSLSYDVITVVHRDRRGRYWIGTTEGLNKLDPETGRCVQYTERHGLPGASVCGILEDDAGHLWISTERGLARFNEAMPDGEKFRVFHPSDGMQEGEFNRGSFSRSSRGEFFFGGKNGLNAFFPSLVADNPHRPQVVFVSVRKLNATMPAELAKDAEGAIVLTPSENVVTFEFAALEFTNPDLNQYAYRMEGFDEAWNHVGHRRTATYTNLDPGTYTFRVKAANSDGVWNEEGAALRLVVIPPFYLTWWFRGIGIALFLAVGPFVYLKRVSKLERENKLRQEFSRQLIDSQELERKRIAGELHDSLGQNIMIMKNKALMALEALKKSGAVERHIEEISDVASETLDEARRIAYNLRPYQLDRFGLTEAIIVMLEDAFAASGIECSCQVENVDGMIPKEEEINIYRIIQEGMNNIVRHSGASKASVLVFREGGGVGIRIEDNGRGFDPDRTSSPHDPGRGFGLAGMHERVRIIGGTIDVVSSPGSGTSVRIFIPLKSSYDGKADKHSDR